MKYSIRIEERINGVERTVEVAGEEPAGLGSVSE